MKTKRNKLTKGFLSSMADIVDRIDKISSDPRRRNCFKDMGNGKVMWIRNRRLSDARRIK